MSAPSVLESMIGFDETVDAGLHAFGGTTLSRQAYMHLTLVPCVQALSCGRRRATEQWHTHSHAQQMHVAMDPFLSGRKAVMSG